MQPEKKDELLLLNMFFEMYSTSIINRPNVAGAVLQTALSLSH